MTLRTILATLSFCIYSKNGSLLQLGDKVDPARILLRIALCLEAILITVSQYHVNFLVYQGNKDPLLNEKVSRREI